MATIRRRTGTEGPKHDPYGFTEICLTRTDGIQVVLHQGLGEWCEVSDQKHFRGSGYLYLLHLRRRIPNLSKLSAKENEAEKLFEQATGLTAKQAEMIVIRKENPTKCTHCGSKQLDWLKGYPGETLLCCKKCRNIVASQFHESEII